MEVASILCYYLVMGVLIYVSVMQTVALAGYFVLILLFAKARKPSSGDNKPAKRSTVVRDPR